MIRAMLVGYDASIAIGAGGRPVISYFDATAAALKVALCANADCTGVATITTVDDSASSLLGSNTSIAISGDGFPVISYQDFSAGVLKVAKCFNAACSTSTIISTVDDPPNFVATSTALAIGADGLPVIAYQDFSANALKLRQVRKPELPMIAGRVVGSGSIVVLVLLLLQSPGTARAGAAPDAPGG